MRQSAMIASTSFLTEISALFDSLRGRHGGYGSPAENLLDTYRVAIIADCLTIELPAGILEFAELCGDDVFGFRLVPAGSANSLAAVHAGIGLFNLCGTVMPQERITSIRSYIASCQTNTGGFGRAPSAIATLADTWLALDCLENLTTS
jgi:hypothetical protein